MSRLFNQTTGWIVRLPWLTLLLILVISGIAYVGYTDPGLVNRFFEEPETTSDAEMIVEDVPAVAASGFSFSAESVLVVESPNFFSPAGARAMRAIVEDLEATEFVADVVWMDEIPMLNIFSLPQPVLPHESASQNRFDLAKEKALKHPFIHGQLLSSDCQTTLLLFTFDRFFIQENQDVTARIREIAQATAARFPDFEAEFTVTGAWPVWITAVESHDANNFTCLLYTSPSPRDRQKSRMPSSA